MVTKDLPPSRKNRLSS